MKVAQRLPEIREAVFSEDFDALNELLIQADQSDLNPAMFGAVLISNNTDMLEVLLNAGANINYQDNYGRTALFLAVKYNRKAVVELLIQKGCDVQLAKFNESNVLHLAAKKGDPDIVQMLLDAGHEVNTQNWGGNTALLIASRFGNKAIVNKLLENGSRLNDSNRLGHTALHYACFQGSKDIVENLLSHGANPDTRTHLGINPIMLACEQDHCRVVELLADKCDLNKCEKLYGAPVLHWAVASGCLRCVKFILDKGASIYTVDKSGRSPVIQAVQSDRVNILEMLLSQYKKEDFYPGKLNSTVLHLASFLGRKICVNLLCLNSDTKFLINQKDLFGETPLDLAVRARNLEVISCLESYEAVTSKKLNSLSVLNNECAKSKSNIATTIASLSSVNLQCPANITYNSNQKSIGVSTEESKDFETESRSNGVMDLSNGDICKSEHVTTKSSSNAACSSMNAELSCGRDMTASEANGCLQNITDNVERLVIRTKDTSPKQMQVDNSETTMNTAINITNECSTTNRIDEGIPVKLQSDSTENAARLETNTPAEKLPGEVVNTHTNSNVAIDSNLLITSQESIPNQNDIAAIGTSADVPNLSQLLSDDAIERNWLPVPLFKTYSPVKMSMIGMLKSVSVEQMVAKAKFNFNTWLDNGPEAFVLKVVSLDITEWLYTTMHNPWSLRELCRGKLRLALGYRANEKVEFLPIPRMMKRYLQMKELEEIDTKDIRIRSTQCYDDIEIE